MLATIHRLAADNFDFDAEREWWALVLALVAFVATLDHTTYTVRANTLEPLDPGPTGAQPKKEDAKRAKIPDQFIGLLNNP